MKGLPRTMVEYNQNYDELLRKAGMLQHTFGGRMPAWLFERLDRVYYKFMCSLLDRDWSAVNANEAFCALAAVVLRGEENTPHGKALLVEGAMQRELARESEDTK